MIQFKEEEIAEDFWQQKLQNAYNLREVSGFLLVTPKSNTYRLVHAEGDGLPGLIIDHYDGHLVFQAHSLGMHKERMVIVEALKGIYGDQLKSIYDKSAETLKKNGAARC